MKKVIKKLFCLSALALLASCGGGKKPSSSEPSTSSSQVAPSSSEKSSSSKKDYVDDELSAGNLVIRFKANGATIDSIKWKSTTIANNGFTVGRVANRIANSTFSIDETQYTVSPNEGSNSLHGGPGSGSNRWQGPFATKSWTKLSQTSSSIVYQIVSPDKENGYPGEMTMTVTYTLSQAGELSIHYNATTTKDTLCNPTNHLFMTLNGNTSYDNIKLWINADNYTPQDSSKLPTGEIKLVSEAPEFDYREERTFDKSVSYDHNLVLNGTGSRKVATMTGASLGVKVDIYTDRPGLQLYKDSNGKICLETQMLPNSINRPEFASYGTTILRKGEEFESTTTYAFSAVEQ